MLAFYDWPCVIGFHIALHCSAAAAEGHYTGSLKTHYIWDAVVGVVRYLVHIDQGVTWTGLNPNFRCEQLLSPLLLSSKQTHLSEQHHTRHLL